MVAHLGSNMEAVRSYGKQNFEIINQISFFLKWKYSNI